MNVKKFIVSSFNFLEYHELLRERGGGHTERESERERERERQTDRQTDRERERDRESVESGRYFAGHLHQHSKYKFHRSVLGAAGFQSSHFHTLNYLARARSLFTLKQTTFYQTYNNVLLHLAVHASSF